MKGLLTIIALMLVLVCVLASCKKDEENTNKKDVITVENGYLVVNGVKTEHKVEKAHNHTFGEWNLYNEDETNCEKKLYYRTCPDCSQIELKEGKYEDHNFETVTTESTCQVGKYDTKTCTLCGKVETTSETPMADHVYSKEYLTDNLFHWQKCKNCSTTIVAEHTLDDDSVCTVCNAVAGATEGLVYELSSDGTYAILIAYEGTETRIRIADTYQGVPVTEIYDEVFYDRSITFVIIPDSVTTIGNQAFAGCTSLTSVVIPDSVTIIGNRAFNGCRNLTSVVIPDSVTTISFGAFYECSSLTDVYYTGSEEEWAKISNYGNSSLGSATIHFNYVSE